MADNNRGITVGGHTGGPMGRFTNKAQKLNNPKGTTKRLLLYLRTRKFALTAIFTLAFFTTIITIAGTRLNGYTVDNYIDKGDISGLFKICSVLGGLYLISAGSMFIQNLLMVKIAQQTSSDIRKDLFERLVKLPLTYFDTHSSGDLMSRLTNDIDNINTTLSQSVTQFFSGIVNILGMFIAMLILNPLLTLIGIITMPFMFVLTKVIVNFTQPYFVGQQRELGRLNGYIEEMVSGQKAVLLFSQQERISTEFSKINSSLTKSAILAQGLSGVLGPTNNIINNTTYLIIAVSGGYMILHGGSLTIGILFTFILYMRNFTRPINEILNIFNSIQSALAGAERVFEIIDQPIERDLEDAKEVENMSGEVMLKNVNFSYNKDKQILKDITLKASCGQTIAIVGPTGSGKTTIINLLTKFYDIDSGAITVDGIDIKNIRRESLRNNISIVLQDTFLFSESVRENIRYGCLTATDDEVVEAAKLGNAHRFITQLPEGYDTILSDNGSNLSHGQRQLLAISRAILSKSSILILDEATSSIDTRTELSIQKAMLNLMKGKTTFVIAHRLSTIRNADCIIAIKDGRIVEQGTHDELIEKKGFYETLYNSQFRTGVAI